MLMASVYASHIHQWAINMEYNVFMPFFFLYSLFVRSMDSFHCDRAFFTLLYMPSVVFHSCRTFTFSQTCLITFTMDYFSFSYFHKCVHKAVASSFRQSVSIFFPSCSLLPLRFGSFVSLILQYVSYMCGHLGINTLFFLLCCWFLDVCIILTYNAALFD